MANAKMSAGNGEGWRLRARLERGLTHASLADRAKAGMAQSLVFMTRG